MAITFTELPGQPGDGAGPSPDGGALSFGGPIEPAPVVTDRTLDEHREIARRAQEQWRRLTEAERRLGDLLTLADAAAYSQTDIRDRIASGTAGDDRLGPLGKALVELAREQALDIVEVDRPLLPNEVYRPRPEDPGALVTSDTLNAHQARSRRALSRQEALEAEVALQAARDAAATQHPRRPGKEPPTDIAEADRSVRPDQGDQPDVPRGALQVSRGQPEHVWVSELARGLALHLIEQREQARPEPLWPQVEQRAACAIGATRRLCEAMGVPYGGPVLRSDQALALLAAGDDRMALSGAFVREADEVFSALHERLRPALARVDGPRPAIGQTAEENTIEFAGARGLEQSEEFPTAQAAAPRALGVDGGRQAGASHVRLFESKRRPDGVTEYHHRDRLVSFTEHGQGLSTRHNDKDVVQAMLDRAAELGWTEIRLTGGAAFRREAWIAATARGLATTGHEPSAQDRAAAVAMREAMARAGTTEGAGTSADAPRQATSPEAAPAEREALLRGLQEARGAGGPVDAHGRPFTGEALRQLQSAVDPNTGEPYRDPRWVTRMQLGLLGATVPAEAQAVVATVPQYLVPGPSDVLYQEELFNLGQALKLPPELAPASPVDREQVREAAPIDVHAGPQAPAHEEAPDVAGLASQRQPVPEPVPGREPEPVPELTATEAGVHVGAPVAPVVDVAMEVAEGPSEAASPEPTQAATNARGPQATRESASEVAAPERSQTATSAGRVATTVQEASAQEPASVPEAIARTGATGDTGTSADRPRQATSPEAAPAEREALLRGLQEARGAGGPVDAHGRPFTGEALRQLRSAVDPNTGEPYRDARWVTRMQLGVLGVTVPAEAQAVVATVPQYLVPGPSDVLYQEELFNLAQVLKLPRELAPASLADQEPVPESASVPIQIPVQEPVSEPTARAAGVEAAAPVATIADAAGERETARLPEAASPEVAQVAADARGPHATREGTSETPLRDAGAVPQVQPGDTNDRVAAPGRPALRSEATADGKQGAPEAVEPRAATMPDADGVTSAPSRESMAATEVEGLLNRLRACKVAWGQQGLPEAPVDASGEEFTGLDAWRLQTALDPDTGRPFENPLWLTADQIAERGGMPRSDAKPVEVSARESFDDGGTGAGELVEVYNASQVGGLAEEHERQPPMDEAQAAQTLRGLAEDAQLRILPRRSGVSAGGQYRHDDQGATLRVRPEGAAWATDVLQGLCRHQIERSAPHEPYGSLPDVDRSFVAGLAAMRSAQALGLPFASTGTVRWPEEWVKSVSGTRGRLEALAAAGDRLADTVVQRFEQRQALEVAQTVDSASVEPEIRRSRERRPRLRGRPAISIEQAREKRCIVAVNAFGPKDEAAELRDARNRELIGLGARWARVAPEEGGRLVCFLPAEVNLQAAAKYLRNPPMTAADEVEADKQFRRALSAAGITNVPKTERINSPDFQRAAVPKSGGLDGPDKTRASFKVLRDEFAINLLYDPHGKFETGTRTVHYVRPPEFWNWDDRGFRGFLQNSSWDANGQPVSAARNTSRSQRGRSGGIAGEGGAAAPEASATGPKKIDDAQRRRLEQWLDRYFHSGAEAEKLGSPYLRAKGLDSVGDLRVAKDGKGTVAVPGYDAEGRLATVQMIFPPEFDKRFRKGYPAAGSFHPVGGHKALLEADIVILAEGAATAMSIDKALPRGKDGRIDGHTVVVVGCYSAVNLSNVAEVLGPMLPRARFAAFADDDAMTAAKDAEQRVQEHVLKNFFREGFPPQGGVFQPVDGYEPLATADVVLVVRGLDAARDVDMALPRGEDGRINGQKVVVVCCYHESDVPRVEEAMRAKVPVAEVVFGGDDVARAVAKVTELRPQVRAENASADRYMGVNSSPQQALGDMQGVPRVVRVDENLRVRGYTLRAIDAEAVRGAERPDRTQDEGRYVVRPSKYNAGRRDAERACKILGDLDGVPRAVLVRPNFDREQRALASAYAESPGTSFRSFVKQTSVSVGTDFNDRIARGADGPALAREEVARQVLTAIELLSDRTQPERLGVARVHGGLSRSSGSEPVAKDGAHVQAAAADQARPATVAGRLGGDEARRAASVTETPGAATTARRKQRARQRKVDPTALAKLVFRRLDDPEASGEYRKALQANVEAAILKRWKGDAGQVAVQFAELRNVLQAALPGARSEHIAAVVNDSMNELAPNVPRRMRPTDRERACLIDRTALMESLYRGLTDSEAPNAKWLKELPSGMRRQVWLAIENVVHAQPEAGNGQVVVRPMALTKALREALPKVDGRNVGDRDIATSEQARDGHIRAVVEVSTERLDRLRPNPVSVFVDKQFGTPDVIILTAGKSQCEEFTQALAAGLERGGLPLSVGVGFVGGQGEFDAVVRSLETQKTASGRTPIIVCGEVERQRKMQDLVAGAAPDKRREVVQASAKDFSRVRKLVEKHAITLQRQASREDVPAQQQPARQNKEVAEPALARSRGRRL